jgi:hypothetical protein
VAADRPRLTVSSSVPGGDAAVALGALTEADRERAQQELANSIEAETVILRQRIVELTAIVERMQQEVQAQEAAQRAADAAAKAPPPVAEPDWWDANALLLAVIVGIPLLLAAALLWTRRYGAARAGPWRPRQAPARPAPGARDARPPAPVLRNAPAGLTRAEPVDIDLDLMDDGKLDLPPRAPAAPTPGSADAPMRAAPARARKPMPPDPSAAARPVQESIRFELDPEQAAHDSDGKRRS